jgi:uncharacterized RDD family membrane protein YckC
MVWYYANNNVREGPLEEPDFNRLVAEGIVRPDTLVWHDGMSTWQAYSTVAPAPQAPVAQPGPPVQQVAQPAAASIPGSVPVAVAEAVEPVRVDTAELAMVDLSGFAGDSPDGEAADGENGHPAAPLFISVPAETSAVPMFHCTQCGRQYSSEELVRFGAAAICADCKDVYTQRMRETGQVAGARNYGGFWLRYVAVVVDSIVQALPVLAIMLPMIFAGALKGSRSLSAMSWNPWLNLFSYGVALLYEAFFLVKYGATPGKLILNLKVITPDGGGLTWGRAIGRHFAARYLNLFTLGIGYIMAAFDSEKRALHDYIAGTRVIRTF